MRRRWTVGILALIEGFEIDDLKLGQGCFLVTKLNLRYLHAPLGFDVPWLSVVIGGKETRAWVFRGYFLLNQRLFCDLIRPNCGEAVLVYLLKYAPR